MKQKIFRIFLVASCILGGMAPFADAQMQKGTPCPVMPGTLAKEKFYVDYHGKRIYLCCAPCVKSFKKHPEKYLKNLPDDQRPSY